LDDFNGGRIYHPAVQRANANIANDVLILGMRERHPELKIWGLNPGFVDTDIRLNGIMILECCVFFLTPRKKDGK
jgi:hypothetical protein